MPAKKCIKKVAADAITRRVEMPSVSLATVRCVSSTPVSRGRPRRADTGVSTRRRVVFGAPMVLAFVSLKPERTSANEESPQTTTADGIEIEDETIGQAGTEPLVGIDVVKVNYAVKIADTGARVDSAKFFVFGSGGEVVRGFEACVYGDEGLGVMPMRVGGKRKMVVPASLGYGGRGAGCDANGAGCRVPPDSRLEFEVELVEVK